MLPYIFYFLFMYGMFSVTPVGDNRATKVFRYIVWWHNIINTNWWHYFIFATCGNYAIILMMCFIGFWISLVLFPFSSYDFSNFILSPLGPLFEQLKPTFNEVVVYVEQAGKKKKKYKSQKFVLPEIKDKEKSKEKCQNIQKARDKKLSQILDEQSGINFDIKQWDKYIRELTLLESLRRILMSVSDKSGLISALVMYAQAHSQRSIIDHLSSLSTKARETEQIGSMLTLLMEQSGSIETVWISDLRACFNNWKRHKDSKVAKNFLALINYVVSVGLCDKAKLTFSIGQMNLFSPIVTKRQLNAGDLSELVIETALGFIEGGWRVYNNKSISSFFLEEDLFLDFENAYNEIRDIHGYSLTGNLRKFVNIDENEYELKLDAAVDLGDKLLKKLGSQSSFERKFITDRLDKIRDYRAEFVQVRTRGGLRIAPFGVSLYGDSAVGKSTLNQLTYEAIGKYNKIDTSAERVATWSDNDKFASNIRASTNVIVFDDFGNTSPKFMDFSPCYRLIQCVNNALFTAPMAEANLKGKVGLHPHIVTITTNVEHLLANVYSEKPESILRRFYHVKVEIKDNYLKDGKLDETKVFEDFGYIRKPDIWKLSVRACIVSSLVAAGSDRRHHSLQPIDFEGRKMIDVDVSTYLRWAQVASKKHYSQQRNLVETMRKDSDDVCYVCGFYGCTCQIPIVEDEIPLVIDEDIMEENVGVRRSCIRLFFFILMSFLQYSYGVWVGTVLNWYFSFVRAALQSDELPSILTIFTNFIPNVDHSLRWYYGLIRQAVSLTREDYARMTNERLLDLQDFYMAHWIFDFVIYLPDTYIDSHAFLLVMLYQRRVEITSRQRVLVGAILFQYVAGIILVLRGMYCRAFFGLIVLNVSVAILLLAERHRLHEELLERRAVAPATIRWLRNHYMMAFGGLLSSIYLLLTLYRKSRILEMQGNLIPTSMADVDDRDKEINPWAELVVTPLPMTIASKTTTTEDLIDVVGRNIVNVESDRFVVKGFYLTSNVLVVPYHYVRVHRENGIEGDIPVWCYRVDRKKVGGNFREKLSEEYSYRIPETDFIAFYSPSSGSVANLVKFLPTDIPSTTDARLVLKESDCSISVTPILFQAQMVEHTSLKFKGGRYSLPFETYNGMCMSPIISKGRGSCIVGFHLAGKNKVGGAGFITQSQAELVLHALNDKEGCIIACSNGNFPKEQYGFQTITDVNIHKKSAARYVSPQNSLEVYGTISGMATPYSAVKDTIISPFVASVTGVPQQWGPPKIYGKGIYPYQVGLEVLSHPSLSLGSYIRPAVVCYRSIFPIIKERLPALFEQTKPLTDVETVSGVDGRRFIDAMNMKSSPGWPLSGRKDKWVIDLDPKDYPHISRPRTFVPEIWEEVERCVNIMRTGERPYFIWKACLKDEPTKLTKTKVRIFQSAPIALQLIIRKYFLPIVRIIQCNPLESECLVGANAEGPEWEQMNNFMLSKGNNILAGDYSKYDQRMPAQLVIASFDILIWIAQNLCGYPMDSILIMRGVVGEVAFPLMAFNGDLVQIFGSNPSGQNLTVVINSIANVLLMRSCYYRIYPRDANNNLFRKYVAMATYGDDAKGSVSPERHLFNHLSFAQFCRDHDIIFTLPDKEGIATEYMSSDDADFLKRTNRYHHDLEINVGVLSEASIFKRLHSHLISKDLSLEMQSAVNIDSSLHDWFYYGRDIFEARKVQMCEIALQANILHLCRGFDISYDERVARWNAKYRAIDQSDDVSDITPMTIIDMGGLTQNELFDSYQCEGL